MDTRFVTRQYLCISNNVSKDQQRYWQWRVIMYNNSGFRRWTGSHYFAVGVYSSKTRLIWMKTSVSGRKKNLSRARRVQ